MYRCPVCPDAVARIRGGANAPHLSGEVRFYQECGGVLVVADISGIPTFSGSGFLRCTYMKETPAAVMVLHGREVTTIRRMGFKRSAV